MIAQRPVPILFRGMNYMRRATHSSSRTMSSEPAAQKLKCIFEDYRQQNYSDELPSRFKKQMIQAMLRRSQRADGRILIQEIERVLDNIGASDRVTKSELEDVLIEADQEYAAEGAVSVQRISEYL